MNRCALIPIALFSIIIASEVVAVSAGQTQEQIPRTSVRAGSSEVVVDVVVTDKRNRLVTNLKLEDFVVLEDGVQQEIASFRLAGQEAGEPGKTPGATGSSLAPARPLRTMILLDYSLTEFQNEKVIRQFLHT